MATNTKMDRYMKILLAPSETKTSGGLDKFDFSTLLFSELSEIRENIVQKYSQLIQNSDRQALSKLFGLKKDSDIERYRHKIVDQATTKAILRYTGVAFDNLDYNTLSKDAQKYIDQNLIIFSNLFGVLRASDLIPDYRLQQGKQIDDIKPDLYYKPHLQQLLDKYLQNEDILDIRAGYYDRYYKPSLPYTTLKFLKNGKVVSHWAKAYRGMVLREIALNNIKNIDQFVAMAIKGLQIEEIQTKRNKTEIIYSIIDY